MNIILFLCTSGNSGGSGSADGACFADDIECAGLQDRLGMEAIKSLHQQLDDDENGNIDLTESDDVSNNSLHQVLAVLAVLAIRLRA